MPATHALIELLGAVALLLWGVHMVRTGILRAFGGASASCLGVRCETGLPRVWLEPASHSRCRAVRPRG